MREKFLEGGWITLVVTGSLVLLCFAVRRHYRKVLEDRTSSCDQAKLAREE